MDAAPVCEGLDVPMFCSSHLVLTLSRTRHLSHEPLSSDNIYDTRGWGAVWLHRTSSLYRHQQAALPTFHDIHIPLRMHATDFSEIHFSSSSTEDRIVRSLTPPLQGLCLVPLSSLKFVPYLYLLSVDSLFIYHSLAFRFAFFILYLFTSIFLFSTIQTRRTRITSKRNLCRRSCLSQIICGTFQPISCT